MAEAGCPWRQAGDGAPLTPICRRWVGAGDCPRRQVWWSLGRSEPLPRRTRPGCSGRCELWRIGFE